MKKWLKNRINLIATGLCSVVFVLAPLQALANGVSTNGTETAPNVLITEFQTGSSTSGRDEFIEVYNASVAVVDLAGWQIRYISATSSSANLLSPTQTLTIVPPATATSVFLPAGASYVFYASTIGLPATTPGQQYSATLPAGGGSIVLLRPDSATCQYVVSDAVAWGAGVYGQGTAIAASSKDADYQRRVGAGNVYANTYNNQADFTVSTTATPGATNIVAATAVPIAAAPSPVGVTNPACTLPTPPLTSGDGTGAQPPSDGSSSDGTDGLQPPGSTDTPPETTTGNAGTGDGGVNSGGSTSSGEETTGGPSPSSNIPISDVGLISPQITELLPNPASPQTDASDEFIELYDANDAPFDLSGFRLTTGLTTQHQFTFPAGTTISPQSFKAFFSADTGLSLSNSGGQVTLYDPAGALLSQTSVYDVATDGQAWALSGSNWRWTTSPTPNAPNSITAPTVAVPKPKATTAAAAKKATSTAKKNTGTASAAKAPKTAAKSKTTTTVPSAATANVIATPLPIHASVLALITLFALLYGAYEYRGDLANRLYQLRSYRTTRRQARQSTSRGRGG